MDVTVVPEAAEEPAASLLGRKVDVVLVSDDLVAHPRLRRTPLFRDELVAVVGRKHPRFRKRRIELAELADEHVIADAGTLRSAGTFGRAMLAAQRTPRKLTIVPTTGNVAFDMARANLGLTLLPRWTFEMLRDESVAALRIGARGLWLRWALATRAETPGDALAAFVAAAREGHPGARRRSSAA